MRTPPKPGCGMIDRCMAEIFSPLGMPDRVTSSSNGEMFQSKAAGVSPDIVAPRGQMGQRLGRTFRFSSGRVREQPGPYAVTNSQGVRDDATRGARAGQY